MAISNPRIVNSWSSLGPPCVSKPLIFVTKRAGSANRQIDLCNDGRGPGWPNSIQNLDQSVSQSVKVVSLSDGVRVASIYMPCCSIHAKSSSSFDCKNFLRKFFYRDCESARDCQPFLCVFRKPEQHTLAQQWTSYPA